MSSESIISIFVVVIVIFGIIIYLISNLGRKEYARSISLFLLSIFTIGVCLSDIPVKGNLYSGLKFILFYHYYDNNINNIIMETILIKSRQK